MNKAQLNAEPFGAAAASGFVTTSMAVSGYATSTTCNAYLIYHLAESVTCSATTSPGFKYITQCASEITASVTSSVAYFTQVAIYASSALTASASAVLEVIRSTYAEASQQAVASAEVATFKAVVWASNVVCGASSDAAFSLFYGVASSTSCVATSTFSWDTTGYHASPDRTMVVSAEDRTMAVT
jgi:hypothetical protein